MGLWYWRYCSNGQSEPGYKRWIEKIKQVREERLETRLLAEERAAEEEKTAMTLITRLEDAETDAAVEMDRRAQLGVDGTIMAEEAVQVTVIGTAEIGMEKETAIGEATETTEESQMTVD